MSSVAASSSAVSTAWSSSKKRTTRPSARATSALICGDALGERAAHAGAGEQPGGVDLDDDAVVERRAVAPVGDALREAAHDARLADAGRADEARAVALALREHVERAVDLGVAPDHRVELAARRGEREVVAERRERRETLRIELEARRGGPLRAGAGDACRWRFGRGALAGTGRAVGCGAG